MAFGFGTKRDSEINTERPPNTHSEVKSPAISSSKSPINAFNPNSSMATKELKRSVSNNLLGRALRSDRKFE